MTDEQGKNWPLIIVLSIAVLGIVGGAAAVIMNVSLTPKEDKAVAQYLAQPQAKSSPFPEELTADFQQRGQWWVANGPAKDRDLKKLLEGGGSFKKFRFIACDITGDGFALLKGHGVSNITIVDTKLDTKSMEALSTIEGMVELEIKNYCTDEILKGLRGPQSLRVLSIKEAKISDEAVKIIATNLPQVTYLSLTGDKRITDGCIKYLKLLPKIHAVHVSDTKVTHKGLIEIINDIKPDKLSLAGLKITDDFVKEHLNKPELNMLNVSFNPITDKSLEVFEKMPKLGSLNIRDCPNISPLAIARLKSARPRMDVRESNSKKKSKTDFLLEE